MDQHEFTHNGVEYIATVQPDEFHGAPWDECDGHGIVSGWERREKRPGELILSSDRGAHRFYDFAESVKIAKRDGWDAEPYTGTRGERAARAVRKDFERLQAWCNDAWSYVGVTVRRADSCGCRGESASLWGVESDYWKETATELTGEIE